MIAPTVHLNGTSGKELDEQMRCVIESLERVRARLRGAYPHGRDYLSQEALDAALRVWNEHDNALAKMLEVWRKAQWNTTNQEFRNG